MEKLKKAGIILLVVVIVFIVGKCKIILLGPSVKMSEKKNVSIYVEDYLTKKYGKHNFKVTKIEYEFKMATIFDYSNRVGYNVQCKSDKVKYFFVYIYGFNPDEYTIRSDSFLENYYFPTLDAYEQFEKRESIIPEKKIESNFISKFKEGFEPNCDELIYSLEKVDRNLGRIPTIEELKNDINVYEVSDFAYTLTDSIENKEEYKNKLRKYLKQNFGGDWTICFNSDVSISCFKY